MKKQVDLNYRNKIDTINYDLCKQIKTIENEYNIYFDFENAYSFTFVLTDINNNLLVQICDNLNRTNTEKRETYVDYAIKIVREHENDMKDYLMAEEFESWDGIVKTT